MKPISLEELYSEEFILRWIVPREFSWNESGPLFQFITCPRGYSGFLHLRHCDAEFTVPDGECQTFHKGDLIFIPSGMRYRMRVFNCNMSYPPTRLLDLKILNSRFQDIVFSQKIRKLPNEIIEIFSLYFEGISDMKKKTYYLHARVAALACHFVGDALKFLRSNTYVEMSLATIAKGVAYMEQNYTSRITNSELAKMCCISSDCFIRTFKKHYGITPKQYLLNLRMDKAKEQLDAHMLSVNEIATHLGFENTPYFSRLFKKKNGITPTEYRNRYSI